MSPKSPTIPILLFIIGLLVILFFYKEKLIPQKQTPQSQKELTTCPKDYTLYKDKDFAFCYPQFLGQVHRKSIPEEANPNVHLFSHHPAYEELSFSSYPAAYDVQSGYPRIMVFNNEEVKNFQFENLTAYSETAKTLEKLLEEKDSVELKRQGELPVLPFVYAGQVIQTRQQFLKGSQFDGLTYITAFAQNIYLTDNSLIYIGKVSDKIVSSQFPLYVFFKAEYEQKINEAVPNDPEGTTTRRLLQEYEEKVVDRQNTNDISPHPKDLDKLFESFGILKP